LLYLNNDLKNENILLLINKKSTAQIFLAQISKLNIVKIGIRILVFQLICEHLNAQSDHCKTLLLKAKTELKSENF